MKQLKYIVPVVVLLAALITAPGCNQADDPATSPVINGLSAVVIPGIEVVVDIIPHNPANRINCAGRNRLIAVAIITTESFDATTVDHATVNFEGAYEAHIDDETGEPIRNEIDIDEDEDLDLVFHFLMKDTDLNCESNEGCLTGETYGGVEIYGCDFIKMFHK